MSAPDPDPYPERRAALLRRLAGFERLAVAFSGGVDSAVLLHAATAVLGPRAVGLIADSPSLPRSELAGARRLAERHGLALEVVATGELADPAYQANRGDRCYWCKTALFDAMAAWADRRGFSALAFGEITDDALDDRPGARAARESGVHAPLSEAGLGKADVRRYAREAGLEVADKPASACLASRIPVGTLVTAERLARIEAAEESLRELGLAQLRVRDRGERARLEVGADELDLARREGAAIGERLAGAGFQAYELATYRGPTERAAT
jgi:uncharacterized protein